MWIIQFILMFILGFSGGKADFIKLLRRTSRDISYEKFNALCSNIGCRPPGGKCDYDAFKHERKIVCSCNKNYTGDLCQHRCSIDCGHNGRCAVFGQKEVCLCSAGYSGPNCGVRETTRGIQQENDNPIKESNPAHNTLHTDGNGCSPVILKQNFPCNLNNGRCVKNTTDFGFMYSCVCKEGWIGTFCNVPCNKKCMNGGYCHVMSSGEQYCICKWNTTGEFCERPQPFQIFIHERFTTKKSTKAKSRKPSAPVKSKVTIQKEAANHILEKSIQKGTENHIVKKSTQKRTANRKVNRLVLKKTANRIVKRSTQFGQSCKRFCGYNSEKCDRIEITLPYGVQTLFICNCKAGWTGPLCEVKCSLPCQNGGKCVSNQGHELCSCGLDYAGELCEVPLSAMGK